MLGDCNLRRNFGDNTRVMVSTAPATAAPPRSALSTLSVFKERRTLVVLALGLSSGLPYFLIFDTLSAWLRSAGLSLEVIGFFSLVTLIFSFKFLWAPMIDRTRVPVLTSRLGHRRSWMLVCQAAIMIGLWMVSRMDPSASLGAIAVFAVLVGFSAATQDIAIDAWRIEAADLSRQGVMAAAWQWGSRIAQMVAGAVPLILAESYGWNVAYAVMVAMMLIGVAAVFAAPREERHAIRHIQTGDIRSARVLEPLEWVARLAVLSAGALLLGSGLAANAAALARALEMMGAGRAAAAVIAAWSSPSRMWFHLLAILGGFAVVILAALPVPGVRTRPGVYLSAALGDPLRDFFARYRSNAIIILALICLYRVPDFLLNIMNPFYLDLGFSLVEIAEVRKIFGVAMTMLGIFAGGVAVARYGLLRAMVIGAVAGPLSNLLFIWLAFQGHDLMTLFLAIGLDNIAGGIAGTCLIAYMSSLTSAGFTATQYALFSSLYAIPGRIIASQSGRIVESAARAADAGGVFAPLRRLFQNLPSQSYAGAVERSGVSSAALGTGYVVFFAYTALIGIFAILLSVIVMRRQERIETNNG